MSCEFCNVHGCDSSDYSCRPFGRLGISISDLYTKGYNFRHLLSLRKITKNGIGIESGFKCGAMGTNGYLGADYSFPGVDVSGQLDTDGDSKGKVRYHHAGGIFSLGLNFGGDGWKGASGVFGAEYSNSLCALGATLHADPKKKGKYQTHADGGGSLKVLDTGASVGAHVKADTTHGTLTDANVGVEYAYGPGIATLVTTKKFTGFTTSYFVKACPVADLGACVDITPQTRVYSLATEWRVDRDSTIKAKIDSTGALSTVFEHRMFNPLVRFGFSSSMDLHKRSLAANKFGIGLSLGDYTAE